MAKCYAIAFGAVGYLIVVWYYATAFAPVTSSIGRTLLWRACVPCGNVDALGSGLPLGAVLLIGPLNALLYGVAGYLVGRVVHRARRGGGSGRNRSVR
jgi:hypothetical protein